MGEKVIRYCDGCKCLEEDKTDYNFSSSLLLYAVDTNLANIGKYLLCSQCYRVLYELDLIRVLENGRNIK